MTRPIKYVISGGVALAADVAVFAAARSAGAVISLANPSARLVGAVTAFLLNRQWTFRRDNPAGWHIEWTRYALLWLAATAISTLAISTLTRALPSASEAVIKFSVEAAIAATNYLISRAWVFRGETA